MKEIPVSQARAALFDVIETANRTGDPIALTKHGKTVAVLVNPEVFERLDSQLEEAYERALLEFSLEEASDPVGRLTLEQVKAELGL